MKLHEPYEPKLRKNYMQGIASAALTAAAAALWLFRGHFSVNTGTLLIISGAAVFSVTLTLWQFERKKENYRKAKELTEKQKDIGKDQGNEIFF